jgi:hypothetical protein
MCQVHQIPRYMGFTCYNCREPSHFAGICCKPKVCFICVFPGHYMIVSGSCTPGTVGRRLRPKYLYRPVPTSSKQLGDHAPCIGYNPSTPSWREGATDLKERWRTRLRSESYWAFPTNIKCTEPHHQVIPGNPCPVARGPAGAGQAPWPPGFWGAAPFRTRHNGM